jgi:hypothetical protein
VKDLTREGGDTNCGEVPLGIAKVSVVLPLQPLPLWIEALVALGGVVSFAELLVVEPPL